MVEPTDNSEWDFETWLADLKGMLKVAGEGYLKRSVDDADVEFLDGFWPPVPSNRTSFAWLAVGIVQNAVAKLPGMRDHVGLAPLHDVVASMIDLGGGGKPPLLQPLKGNRSASEATTRRWVRQHALLFVQILVQSGMTATEACQRVAEVLARAGHRNRKRDGEPRPLSWKTVEGWWTASRQRGFAAKDPRIAEFLNRSIARIEAEWGGTLTLRQSPGRPPLDGAVPKDGGRRETSVGRDG